MNAKKTTPDPFTTHVRPTPDMQDLRDRPSLASMESYHPDFLHPPGIGRSPDSALDAPPSESSDLVIILSPGEDADDDASLLGAGGGRVIVSNGGWLRT